MPRPTARVLALLEILQGGGTRRVGDLARRLDVDERTVRRYVDHLLDLGVPVESVRGRYGGLRLAPGYRMAPLMLSEDEAVAVLLGLLAGERSGLVTQSSASASATAKLQRVLPAPLRRRTQALLETVSTTAPRQRSVPAEGRVLLRLAEAAREQQPVAIAYTARDGRRTDRTIHPHGVVAHAGRWYVVAADAGSGEARSFRLDRIVEVSPLPGRFEAPNHVDPTADLLEGLAGAPWAHRVSVRVRGTREEVGSRLPAGLALVEQDASDPAWLRVRVRAERLDWVPALLAGLDRPFVVEEPAELVGLVGAFAARLASYVAP